MLGREGEREASRWSSVEPGSCFSQYVGGMIIEDELDRGAGRISGVEMLEEFDELSAAVAVSDERMDLPGKQVDSGQQAQRAMAFVLVIPREARVDAGHGRQIRRRRCDGLDSRLFIVGNDCHSLDGFARLGSGFFQNLDLAVDAQNLRHLLLEFGIATFQIVATLVRFDFLLAEYLAHRALDQLGETFVPRRRSMLAGVTCQQPRGPQFMRITVLLGLVARQRHQPGFGLRCDDWFFARPWSILDRCQRPIGQRPLHAALNRLMMDPNSLPHRTERRILAIGQQHLCPRYPARRLGSRPRKSRQSFHLFLGRRQFDYSPPSCHYPAPRFANRKTRNPPPNYKFHDAGFMEIDRLAQAAVAIAWLALSLIVASRCARAAIVTLRLSRRVPRVLAKIGYVASDRSKIRARSSSVAMSHSGTRMVRSRSSISVLIVASSRRAVAVTIPK